MTPARWENLIILVGLFCMGGALMFRVVPDSSRELIGIIIGGLLTHLRTHTTPSVASQNVENQTVNTAPQNAPARDPNGTQPLDPKDLP